MRLGNLQNWLSSFFLVVPNKLWLIVYHLPVKLYQVFLRAVSLPCIILSIYKWYYITINIHSEIRLFPDDILLYRSIKTWNNHRILQDDSNTSTKWTDHWLMEFYIPKCKINIMQITTHYNTRNFTLGLRLIFQHNFKNNRSQFWQE